MGKARSRTRAVLSIMTNNEIVAGILLELADLVDLKGDEPYKSRAYRLAADRILRLPEDVAIVAAEGRLKEIPGVGDAIANKIGEILATGTLRLRDRLRQEIPPGVMDLLHVPGIGPRTASLLFKAGITSLGELRAGLDDGRLFGIRGLGPKKLENLRQDVERYLAFRTRLPAGDLWPVAGAVAGWVAAKPGVVRVDVTGALRRHAETAGGIDLVAAAEDPVELAKTFAAWEKFAEATLDDPSRASGRLPDGTPVGLVAVRPAELAPALFRTTGSEAHVRHVEALIQARGLRLDEATFDDEQAIYAAAGLVFVPPELREDRGEVELASKGELPVLVERKDLQGDLHCHTTYSDGTSDLEAMAIAAREHGLHYLAITDHSPSLAVAHGLDRARLMLQKKEIDRLNERWSDFRLLWGMEVDILPDGRLDMDDETLALLDVVIASVHTAFHLSKDAMTARVCRALENPHVDILGHPTGRLLGRRDPYEIDLDEVIRAAAQNQVAIEINAHPWRLDLDAEHVHKARAEGVRLVVNSDAHGPGGFDDLEWGVYVARRGWLGPADVVNTMALPELLMWLRRRS